MSINKVIISGGGTGGHIFPALSIANEIKRRNPDAEILFIGAKDRMEMEKVPAAGYKIIGLPVQGFPRKPSIKIFKFFSSLYKSLIKAKKIVKEFQPDVAVGVGGFASGPTLYAASKRNIPTLIQEQNSYAGMTNKLLGKRVDKICVAYDKMQRYFPEKKIIYTGNPIRANLINREVEKSEACKYFNLNSDKKVVLIVGGSLGARSINNAVLANINELAKIDIEVIWQTGAYYYDKIVEATKNTCPQNIHIHKFITKMDYAYEAADLIISRSGAGTISELCLIGKPVILVPSPNVAEDHQTKNTMALVEKEAAILIKDNEIEQKIVSSINNLLQNEQQLEMLSKNIKKLAMPNATSSIVNEIEKLLSNG
ncbi:MAG: undecaprenyldiphospho-muramoylpentapeptide beta-N-acetylglucosaminyltransferase [Draconibacterium sp.]|nr:MAG: undecaprenyldiphospho-muramoylpentapeptide beta-N-acetylglucosaminyltransferase [Draconibacterium sp.]